MRALISTVMIVLAATFTGCSSSDNGGDEATPPAATEEAAEDAEAETQASDGGSVEK